MYRYTKVARNTRYKIRKANTTQSFALAAVEENAFARHRTTRNSSKAKASPCVTENSRIHIYDGNDYRPGYIALRSAITFLP